MNLNPDYSQSRKVFREARTKGISWLLQQQQTNGALLPTDNTLSTYYKGALALASAGETPAGQNLLGWIQTNALTSEGDFQGKEGRGAQQFHAAYPNAWIIVGAQHIGDFSVSYPAIRYLLSLQDPESGGFFRIPPGGIRTSNEISGDDPYVAGAVPGSLDLMNSSMAGLACLSAGKLEEARRAGDFIVRILKSQPFTEGKFYFMWKVGSGLITDVDDAEVDAFLIDGSKSKQRYFQLGIAAAFLARLYQASGDPLYLRSAKEYIDATFHLADDRYKIPASGKVGWGAAYVYQLTGENKYRAIAEEVGHALVDLQGSSGSWVEDSSMSQRVEITCEFVTLLTEIEASLTVDSVN